MTDKELKKLLEAQKRATRQVQFFLDEEREVHHSFRNEVKESNEDYQETIRELRREIEDIHGWYEEKLQNFVEGVKWTPMDERTDGNHKEK